MTAGLLSLALGLILVPIVRKLSFRLGVVATPRADRWHSKPTPKIGGVGIFLAFAFTIAILHFSNPIGFQQWL
jgi:UDP-GlcNAc:undecaprenyl-phosphate GlcNAc-1-phosphate transferase